jgi:hypothetical protein
LKILYFSIRKQLCPVNSVCERSYAVKGKTVTLTSQLWVRCSAIRGTGERKSKIKVQRVKPQCKIQNKRRHKGKKAPAVAQGYGGQAEAERKVE